ncbi:MAG TPA: vitamin K epoxide reductase family protein [Candidatus Saccharimonadales bacterium]|nr:vitamin K epoxide reductase family protein [Candidatus Saccharimonadales bacterium]
MNKRFLYSILVSGAALGLIASFLEMVEYVILLKNPHAVLTCNINGVFSCSNVLNAWQSSIFGFPNALMCITFFTLLLGAGLAGVSGSTIARRLRLTLQGLALFFVCFGSWFLWQSTYHIHTLCILCLFCFAGLLMINWSLLRLNEADLRVGKTGQHILHRIIQSGADTFWWFLLGMVLAFMMLVHFR